MDKQSLSDFCETYLGTGLQPYQKRLLRMFESTSGKIAMYPPRERPAREVLQLHSILFAEPRDTEGETPSEKPQHQPHDCPQ
ncbi:hypothetical protein K2D_17030 [Planctomycetes bacterium K2D]|nr:hypothetical protein K2D_17030 [Planctomycetes bacterium K2D]